MIDADADNLVATHAAGWIADAECLGRMLDWRGFRDSETLHVVHAAALPPEARRYAVAWTAPGLRPLLAELLSDHRGGPVVVIDVSAVFRRRVSIAGKCDRQCHKLGRLETQQVLLHELAHVRVDEASGETPVASVAALLEAVSKPQTRAIHDHGHGLQWLRAYCHLSHRAAELWPWRWWIDVGLSSDVEAHGLGDGHNFVETLAGELELGRDEPLAEILRRD